MNRNWPTIIYLAILHLGALTAPFCFSWSGLAMFIFTCWLTGGLGVGVGYHRLLTHASFETYRPVEWFLAWLGGMSGEGSAIQWVADHRKHHQYSDQPGDPHSPREGRWWAHVGWTFWAPSSDDLRRHRERYVPDLLRDPVMRFLDHTFILWHFVFGALLFVAGGWSWLVWGLFLRLVVVMNATWCVNSLTHGVGYRNYETDDDSTNLLWLAFLTFGEGNHNNHHHAPRRADHGHRWFEFDPNWRVIQLMKWLGLAWDVQR